MYERAKILHSLLSNDGTMFVHIDDNELGYIIVMLDEIFGRKNRLYIVTFKQGAATGHKAINPGCVTTTNKLKAPEKLKLGQKIIMPGINKVKPVASKTITKYKKVVAFNKILRRYRSISNSRSASLPVRGKLSSKYGSRWGRQHAGIDIAAHVGTGVFAYMDGTVTFSSWNDDGYGNLVIIDHGNGLKSYYAHNSKLLVEKGQWVNKDTNIAEVGNTGKSTGPHSHFEIRKNDSPINPYNYVK